MKSVGHFHVGLKSIPVGGLSLAYKLDEAFFKAHDNALLGPCEVDVQVDIRRFAGSLEVEVDHVGSFETSCDRCLAMIRLPLAGNRCFTVKFVEEAREDEAEIIYIDHEADTWNLASLINDCVTLSLPLSKTYDCESDDDRKCNESVLQHLREYQSGGDIPTEWDLLKHLNLNN